MIYGRGYSRDPVDRLTDRVETRATGQHRGVRGLPEDLQRSVGAPDEGMFCDCALINEDVLAATSFGSRRPVSGPDDSARAKRLIGSEE